MIAHTCAASTHLIGFIAEWVCAPRKLLCTKHRLFPFTRTAPHGVSFLLVDGASVLMLLQPLALLFGYEQIASWTKTHRLQRA